MTHRNARPRALGSVLAALGLLASVAAARADVDTNGPWAVTFIYGPGITGLTRTFDLVQTGSSLSISCSDPVIGPISATGTIDPDTGIFSANGTANGLFCPLITIQGTATADDAFTGTFLCTNGLSGGFVGSRCGNGVVDFGDECDGVVDCCDETCHWKAAGGTCQPDSDSCTYDICDAGHLCTHPLVPAGTDCAGDGIQCTADVCDASGACTHPIDDTNQCNDGNDCTENDACSAGVCAGTNRAVGSPCGADTNICTADTCDGAGTCIQGPCSPCCSPGCFPQLASGCAHPTTPTSKLLMRRDGGVNDALQWKWNHGEQTDVADFGTPLSSTDYVLCVYGNDPLSQLFLQYDAKVDGGGMCGGVPCWKQKGDDGFSYKDDTQSSDGIGRLSLKAGSDGNAKIVLKGKGPNLKLDPIYVENPLTVQLRASNGKCWEAQYPTFRVRGDDLRANKGQ